MQIFGLKSNIETENYDLYLEYKFQDIEINIALESIDYINNQLGLEAEENAKIKKDNIFKKLWTDIKKSVNKIFSYFEKKYAPEEIKKVLKEVTEAESRYKKINFDKLPDTLKVGYSSEMGDCFEFHKEVLDCLTTTSHYKNSPNKGPFRYLIESVRLFKDLDNDEDAKKFISYIEKDMQRLINNSTYINATKNPNNLLTKLFSNIKLTYNKKAIKHNIDITLDYIKQSLNVLILLDYPKMKEEILLEIDKVINNSGNDKISDKMKNKYIKTLRYGINIVTNAERIIFDNLLTMTDFTLRTINNLEKL